MKKITSARRLAAGITILILIITGVFCLFGCNKSNKPVSDFERIDIRETGMRLTCDYEYVNLGEETEITLYYFNYADGSEKRVPQKSVRLETKAFIEKLNEVELASWDGFHGKHPKHVSDGKMFSLTASINGEQIKADGSENFPKNYKDFMRWSNELLTQDDN